jgi:hypothetical protein
MFTFVPYADFAQSARILSTRHLRRQRVDALTLLTINSITPHACLWIHHRGALILYYHAMIDEWERRGYKGGMPRFNMPASITLPSWLNTDIHDKHQRLLLQLDPEHYRCHLSMTSCGPTVPSSCARRCPSSRHTPTRASPLSPPP